jgi:hypothetical protein
MKKLVLGALVAALALPAVAAARTTHATGVPQQIAALQRTVKTQQKEIAALTGQLTTLKTTVTPLAGSVTTLTNNLTSESAIETCHFAELGTVDMGFDDLFDIIAGQPEQFVGQSVSDNGACAAAGLTAPTPAESPRLAATLSPAEQSMRALALLLGALRSRSR